MESDDDPLPREDIAGKMEPELRASIQHAAATAGHGGGGSSGHKGSVV